MSLTEIPPLLFPVGHPLGPHHPARGEPPAYHGLRIGWSSLRLPDREHADLWALTRGLPERLDARVWDREAVLEAAAEARIDEAEARLDHLVELGAVAEVHFATAQAVEFARTHLVQAMLVGLGNSADPAEPPGIGIPGLPPVVRVDPEVYEIWQLAPLWPTLWGGCESFAKVDRDHGETRADRIHPERVLDRFLTAIRVLIAHHAVFLDRARD